MPKENSLSDNYLDLDLLKGFKDPSLVVIGQYQKPPMVQFQNAITIPIPGTENLGNINLDLIEVPTSNFQYKLTLSSPEKLVHKSSIRHYRGIIKDNPNSIVAISFHEHGFMGIVSNKEGNFNLVYDEKKGLFLFFNEKNVKSKNEYTYYTQDDIQLKYDSKILGIDSKILLSTSNYVKIYLETDYSIYQSKGSSASVEFFVSGAFNQVAALYENENIQIFLSEIFIWNSPDPYTGVTAAAMLSSFQSHRLTINGDLGQLLTLKNIGGGIAAGFNGICNTYVSEKLSVSMIESFFLDVPVYSFTVQIIAHELGHLFGSRHTHACVWNGNNTAIDGCAGATEGGCPLPGIPPGGGTIMSYCHLKSVGINFNLGFGIQPGNVIRNSVQSASCLCKFYNGSIQGDAPICTSGIFSLIDLPVGFLVNWSVTGSYSISGSSTSDHVMVEKSSNGTGVLTATITNECGDIFVLTKELIPYSLQLDFSLPGLCPEMFASVNYMGATTFTWTLTSDLGFKDFPGQTLVTSNNSVELTGTAGMVKVEADFCGTSINFQKYFEPYRRDFYSGDPMPIPSYGHLSVYLVGAPLSPFVDEFKWYLNGILDDDNHNSHYSSGSLLDKGGVIGGPNVLSLFVDLTCGGTAFVGVFEFDIW